MSFELTMLLWSAVLALVHVSIQAILRKAEVGIAHDVGPRDNEIAVTGVVAGRAERAFRNFRETYAIFVALVAVVALSGASDALTQWGAGIYLGFRVVYLPLYLAGVPWIRSFAWNIATAGLALMIAGVLL